VGSFEQAVIIVPRVDQASLEEDLDNRRQLLRMHPAKVGGLNGLPILVPAIDHMCERRQYYFRPSAIPTPYSVPLVLEIGQSVNDRVREFRLVEISIPLITLLPTASSGKFVSAGLSKPNRVSRV
jgi:hypothetical protein